MAGIRKGKTDTMPPSYTEVMDGGLQHTGASVEPPQYSASNANSLTVEAGTKVFPSQLNGYSAVGLKSIIALGPNANEKLFTVSQTSLFSLSNKLKIHYGDSVKNPVLVEANSWKSVKNNSRTTITLHLQDGRTVDREVVVNAPTFKSKFSPKFTFQVDVSKGGPSESFQWRSSRGSEIRELAGGVSFGYKLVRETSQPQGLAQIEGKGKKRERGMSSDGKEIVAAVAHNASLSLNKGLKFAFKGTGQTGTLGEEFELMAVMTAVSLYVMDMEAMMGGGSGGGGGDGGD
uniref:ARAD1C18348p n=1 Tax=Blastobotrys adeninivorans TaxID=409370 RepID=A0A060T757_BLAAD